jgi:hypothetical protein
MPNAIFGDYRTTNTHILHLAYRPKGRVIYPWIAIMAWATRLGSTANLVASQELELICVVYSL